MPDDIPKKLSDTTDALKKTNEVTEKVVDKTADVIKETEKVVDKTADTVNKGTKQQKKVADVVDDTADAVEKTAEALDRQAQEQKKSVENTNKVSSVVEEERKNADYRADKFGELLEDVGNKYSNFNEELIGEITNFGSIIESATSQVEKAQQGALGGISETMTESFATTLSLSERFAYRIHAQADRNITSMNTAVEGMEEMKTETGKFMEKRMVTMANQLLTADHKQAIEIKEQMTALRERAYLLQGEERERMLAMADSMEAGMGQLTDTASIFKESIFQALPKLDSFVENTLLGGGILGKFAGGMIRAAKAKKQAQAAADIQLEEAAQKDFANEQMATARGADVQMGGEGNLTQEQMQSVTDSTNKYLQNLVSLNRTILGLEEREDSNRLDEKEVDAEGTRLEERRHQELLDQDGQTVEISEGKCGIFSKIMGLLKGNFIGAAAAFLMSPMKKVAGIVMGGLRTIGGGMAKVGSMLLPKSWSSKIGGFFSKLGKDQAGMVKQTKSGSGMLSGIVKKLSGTMKSIFGAISKVFKSLGKIIKQVIDTVMKVLGRIGKGIADIMKHLAKGISHFGTTKVIKGAVALLIIAAGIFVFAKAMQEFGKVTWKAVAVGIVSMTALGVGMAFMGKLTGSIIKGAVALLIVAAATWVFSKAMIGFNNISWKAVAVGLVTVVAFGLVMAGLGFLATQIAMGGAAMILVAVAVFILGKAMVAFTKVSWKAVGVALVSIVALAVAVGVLGMIMMSGVGAAAIVLGAAALIIIAVAVGILGLALILFSKGIKPLMPLFMFFGKIVMKMVQFIGKAFLKLIDNIVPIIEAVAQLIVKPIEAIGAAISLIIETIAKSLSLIIKTIGNLLAKLVKAIVKPIEAIGKVIVLIIDAISKGLALLLNAVGGLIGKIADAIVKPIEAIGAAISLVVNAISKGLALFLDSVGGLIESIGNAIAKPIEAIGKAIATVAGSIGDAIVNVVNAVTESFIALSGSGIGAGLKDTALGIGAITLALAAFLAVEIGGGVLGAVGNVVGSAGNWIAGWFGGEAAATPMQILGALASFPHQTMNKTPAAIDNFIGAIKRFSSMEIDGDSARETIGVIAGLAGAIKAFESGTPGLLENLGDLVGGALSAATGWLGSLFGIKKSEKDGPLDILAKLVQMAPKVSIMGPALSEMVEGMLSLMAFADAKVDTKAFKQFFGFLASMPLDAIKQSADAITNLAESIDHLAESMGGLQEIQAGIGKTAGGQALLATTGTMVGPGAVIQQNEAQNANLQEERTALQQGASNGAPAVNTLMNNSSTTNNTMVIPPSPRNNENALSRVQNQSMNSALF